MNAGTKTRLWAETPHVRRGGQGRHLQARSRVLLCAVLRALVGLGDGDVLVVQQFRAPRAFAAIVKNGKVFEVPDEIWMSGIGVQAAEQILADVAEATGVRLPKE